MHNQRGIILERAIRRYTANVVLCRLRYRLATLAATPEDAGHNLGDPLGDSVGDPVGDA